MKDFAICLAVMCSFAPVAAAGMAPACATGTLSSYIALGSGGCFIGNDQVNNFQALSVLAGASAIAPGSVTITPGGSDTNPSLSFSLSSTVSSNLINDLRFTYQIGGNKLSSSTITLSNTSFTGDGVVTYGQNICAGGVFGADGVSGCTGVASSLAVANSGSDQSIFGGVSFLRITDNFTLDGGLAGSASGGQFLDQFTAAAAGSSVPEPAMLPVLAVGVALLLYWKRRRVAGAVNHI